MKAIGEPLEYFFYAVPRARLECRFKRFAVDHFQIYLNRHSTIFGLRKLLDKKHYHQAIFLFDKVKVSFRNI